MYSKLGGCLGVTAKLGPLARTDLCAGVKGLLERLMTHLGQQFCPALPTKECKVRGHIVIPYTQGLCESIKRICGRYGIQTHFKGGKTIKNLLVSPKDKDPMFNQSGAIYRYQCNNLGCDDEYIGENLQDPLVKDTKST